MNYLHSDLYEYAKNNHVEMVKSLTDKEVDMNAQTFRSSSLHSASIRGDLDEVKSLLKSNKINVNLQDNDGLTPLHVAVMFGRSKVVEALLKSNEINVNLQDYRYKWSPLHIAAERCKIGKGSIEIIEALLKSNEINVNLKDSSGLTPLHKFVQQGDINIVRALLKSDKIDINLQDNSGKAVLHLAAQEGNIDMVDAILKSSKIDVSLRDNDGNDPLYYAVKNGHGSSVGLLLINAVNKSKVVGEEKDGVDGNDIDLEKGGWHAEYHQNTDTELTMMEKDIESEYLI